MAWRLFDIVVGLVGLILFAPVILLCAVATVLDSGWPPFNGSWRMGKHGRPFRCWKIRTLTIEHEAILEKHLAESEAARREWHSYAKLTNDPRQTRLGRILRRFSADELPQLWNLLRGDLATFGPRAFLVSEGGMLGVWGASLIRVRPGLVSYYTAHGRSRLTVEQRVRLDSKFAKRMGKPQVKWDAFIRTVKRLMDRRGAG